MSEKTLEFVSSPKGKDIQDVFDFNLKSSTDDKDSLWTEANIRKQITEGWELFSVVYESELIAAIFIKKAKTQLLTRNTSIKLAFQGNGFSHQIKDFYEEHAKSLKLKSVINYCRRDNFRGISLNETHGYKKTGESLGDNQEYQEWEKVLKA